MLAPLAGHNLRSALLAGDLNSNSLLWNSPHTCPRGELIESFVLANDLVTLNQPSLTPSYQSSVHETFIDAAFASGPLASNLISWEPLEIDTFGSDHGGFF